MRKIQVSPKPLTILGVQIERFEIIPLSDREADKNGCGRLGSSLHLKILAGRLLEQNQFIMVEIVFCVLSKNFTVATLSWMALP